jgi:2-methylcitrate dehydratase PrpD
MSKPAVTLALAEQACALNINAVPENVRTIIRQCLLDYLGVTLAGIGESPVQLLLAELQEEGGAAQASIHGTPHMMSLTQAALLNGMASHAIDYDDVNFALMGHPSVPVLPALLAQAPAHDGVDGGDEPLERVPKRIRGRGGRASHFVR